MQELQDLHSSAEVRDLGIRVAINEADITDISAEVDGPPGKASTAPADGVASAAAVTATGKASMVWKAVTVVGSGSASTVSNISAEVADQVEPAVQQGASRLGLRVQQQQSLLLARQACNW
jgi:hypothetical protein